MESGYTMGLAVLIAGMALGMSVAIMVQRASTHPPGVIHPAPQGGEEAPSGFDGDGGEPTPLPRASILESNCMHG